MNHLTTILLSGGILLTGIAAAAQDMIIFRDGRVKSVKIIQTNNDKTLFRESADKHAEEEYVENTKVFMLNSRRAAMWCSTTRASAFSPRPSR